MNLNKLLIFNVESNICNNLSLFYVALKYFYQHPE